MHPKTRKEILEAARICVCGDREQDYGSPENNFKTIAYLWNDYICAASDGLMQTCLSPVDVAAMLALLKIARIASGHAKMDNWVDLAGYAACGGELEAMDKEAAPEQKDEPSVDAYRSVKRFYPCAVIVYEDDSWNFGENNVAVVNPNHIVKHMYEDCFVELLRGPNGEESYGWWRADNPPANLSALEEFWNGD